MVTKYSQFLEDNPELDSFLFLKTLSLGEKSEREVLGELIPSLFLENSWKTEINLISVLPLGSLFTPHRFYSLVLEPRRNSSKALLNTFEHVCE